MCTRIFNHLNEQYPITARNMDWGGPVDTYFYAFPKGLERRGIPSSLAQEKHLNPHQIKSWTSRYASLVAMMGNDKQGFASVDGLNEHGLVANGLYDSDTSYQANTTISCCERDSRQYLSANYWVQFALDRFKTAHDVAKYFEKQKIQLMSDALPGFTPPAGIESVPANLHLSVSDASGHSAVIEVRKGKFVVYYDKKYDVVTNQPSFETQRKLTDYWRFIWGIDTDAPVQAPVYSAPGGNTPSQRFERASYYLAFSSAPKNRHEALYQARSLVASCSVPVNFKTPDHPVSSYTIWTNLADHTKKRYYLTSTVSMNTVWMDFPKELNQSKRLFLQHQGFTKSENNSLAGNVTSLLEDCQNPYV